MSAGSSGSPVLLSDTRRDAESMVQRTLTILGAVPGELSMDVHGT